MFVLVWGVGDVWSLVFVLWSLLFVLMCVVFGLQSLVLLVGYFCCWSSPLVLALFLAVFLIFSVDIWCCCLIFGVGNGVSLDAPLSALRLTK